MEDSLRHRAIATLKDDHTKDFKGVRRRPRPNFNLQRIDRNTSPSEGGLQTTFGIILKMWRTHNPNVIGIRNAVEPFTFGKG